MHPIAKLIREPVVVVAGDGQIIDMNRPARQRFGEAADSWRDLFANLDGLRSLLERASGTSEPVLGARAWPARSPRSLTPRSRRSPCGTPAPLAM